MTAPPYADTAVTGNDRVQGNVIEVVNAIFHKNNLKSPLEEGKPISDEADDLAAALEARDRLNGLRGEPMSLEDAIRAQGLDPADFGLE